MDYMAPIECRVCGEVGVVGLVIGMPHPRAIAASERGELMLAGCVRQPPSRGFPVACRECEWSGVLHEGRLVDMADVLVDDAVELMLKERRNWPTVDAEVLAEMAAAMRAGSSWEDTWPHYRPGKDLERAWEHLETILERWFVINEPFLDDADDD